MQHLPHMKVPFGGGGSDAFLPLGVYFYDGNAINDGLTPYVGQPWIDSTSELQDGLVGDHTAPGVVATGMSFSLLFLHAEGPTQEIVLAVRYQGDVSFSSYRDWITNAFVALTDENETPWPNHFAASFEDRTATFTANSTDSRATLVVLEFTTANASCTDARWG